MYIVNLSSPFIISEYVVRAPPAFFVDRFTNVVYLLPDLQIAVHVCKCTPARLHDDHECNVMPSFPGSFVSPTRMSLE